MIKSSRIAVIYGGESNERDVSIRSGKNVMGALKRQGYTNLFHWDPKEHELKDLQADAAFIALHGKHGEDGTIQGALELKRIPYTGTGVLGSAIGMNKWLCKQLMTACGLPTAPYQLLTDTVTIQWPVVAKPIAGGSSIGVHFCANDDELEAVKKTLKNPETYFIEEQITGKEVTVGLLELPGGLTPLPVLELRSRNEFYDYDAKYSAGKTDFILPAELDSSTTKQCQRIGAQLYESLNCKTVARIDIIIHPSRGPMILEINTIPGLTDLSDIPAQAKESGIQYDDLIHIMMQTAQCETD